MTVEFRKFKSIRQEKLPEAARDVIAWALACNITFIEGSTMQKIKAVEVRLDDSLQHIYEGGLGVYFHSPNDSWDSYEHKEDEDWAVVFAHDCTGNPERGMAIVQAMNGVTYNS